MKIKYEQLRAFVSSRMEELSAERKIVKDALDELRVLAWVYEDDAGAQPRSPEESYREELKKSDLFIYTERIRKAINDIGAAFNC